MSHLVVFRAAGQNNQDSLINLLSVASHDTSKISLLIELSNITSNKTESLSFALQAYEKSKLVPSLIYKGRAKTNYGMQFAERSLDTALLYIDQALIDLSAGSHYKDYAFAAYQKGKAYELNGELEVALNIYVQSHKVASEHKFLPEWRLASEALFHVNRHLGNNSEALKWGFELKKACQVEGNNAKLGEALNFIGFVYESKGFYFEAMDKFVEAKEIAIQIGDPNLEVMCDNVTGILFHKINNLDEAIRYLSQALEKAILYKLKHQQGKLQNNLGILFLKQENYPRALTSFYQSISILGENENYCSQGYPMEGLGSVYMKLDKIDSAQKYLDKALIVCNKCKDTYLKAAVLKAKGELYLQLKDYKASLSAFEESLQIANQSQLVNEKKEALYGLYYFYRVTGQIKRAFHYLERYQSFSDSIANKSNVFQASTFASEYEFRKEIRALEIERKESEQQLAQQIDSKSVENKVIIIAASFILILAVIFIRGYAVIRRQNEKLRFLNREKNQLMGIVAHDLRNPVSNIIGLSQILRHQADFGNADEQFMEHLGLVSDSAKKMSDMIERVLDVSAIENMTLNLRTEKSDLRSVLTQVIENFEIIAGQKEIKIESHWPSDQEFFSEVDPKYLEQVIDNLVSNAIKFSEKGKMVFVSLWQENENNVIEVKDQGPGISQEDQKEIFKAFRTASSKPTTQEKSTGLGLSIALRFIQAMNGNINIKSEEGEGTSFMILFSRT